MATIQIIDDDIDIAESIAALLEAGGHDTNILTDTDGAEDVLARNKPDLLVLDVMFPENPAAGFDLARRIRRREDIKNLPIILLTGINQDLPMNFSEKDIDEDWMPVQHFIEKPVKPDELVKKVDEQLS